MNFRLASGCIHERKNTSEKLRLTKTTVQNSITPFRTKGRRYGMKRTTKTYVPSSSWAAGTPLTSTATSGVRTVAGRAFCAVRWRPSCPSIGFSYCGVLTNVFGTRKASCARTVLRDIGVIIESVRWARSPTSACLACAAQ